MKGDFKSVFEKNIVSSNCFLEHYKKNSKFSKKIGYFSCFYELYGILEKIENTKKSKA